MGPLALEPPPAGRQTRHVGPATAGAERASVLAASDLPSLVDTLRGDGFRVFAPLVDRGTLRVQEITGGEQLPRGLEDDQRPGTYRLRRQGDRYFGYTVPGDGWKRLFTPPRLRLWRARREGERIKIEPGPQPDRPPALVGVRSCDLAAIAIQDRVLLEGEHPDPAYRARRCEQAIRNHDPCISCATHHLRLDIDR